MSDENPPATALQNTSQNDFVFIETVYQVIERPDSYIDVFKAWDNVIDDVLAEDVDDADIQARSKALFHNHFDRALRLFQAYSGERQTAEHIVASQPTAAIVANDGGKILSLNDLARTITALDIGDHVKDLPLDADRYRSIDKALRGEFEGSLILRGARTDGDSVLVFVIERVHLKTEDNFDRPHLLIRTTETIWRASMVKVLSSAFGLTETECELVKALSAGLSLEKIATMRERSILTIRTQMNSILQKTQTHSQGDLLRLVTALMHVSAKSETSESDPLEMPSEGHDGPDSLARAYAYDIATPRLHTLSLSDGRYLEYADIGPASGRPVLFVFPTTPPTFPRTITKTLHKHGIRAIAPLKPGAGGSSAVEDIYSIEQRALDNFELMDHLNAPKFGIAGHCSGGAYAVHMATYNPQRVGRILLIDTGAPTKSVAQFRNSAVAPRRTFVAARVAPWMLKMPHKLVAKDFFEGGSKQEKVIDYFYHAHPQDLERLKDPVLRSLARQMIAYCLNDIDQLINDIKVWVSNWSPAADSLSQTTELRFLHGRENNQFNISHIETFAKDRKHVSVISVDDAAQLLLYTHPDKLGECLRWVTE